MSEIIVLIGGPGCGKGSIARELLMRDNYNYIETGAMFRTLPTDSPIAIAIAAGNLVPDDELFSLIESKCTNNAILFDGFPRTLNQAKWLVKNYKNRGIKIIYLNVPESVMRARIHKRKTDGSARADDSDESIITRRLENYRTQTVPAIEWLRNCNAVKFLDTDASQDIRSILADNGSAIL